MPSFTQPSPSRPLTSTNAPLALLPSAISSTSINAAPSSQPTRHRPASSTGGHSFGASSSKSSLSGRSISGRSKAVSFVGDPDDPVKLRAKEERGSTKSLADFLRETAPEEPKLASAKLSPGPIISPSGSIGSFGTGSKSSKRPGTAMSTTGSLFSLGRKKAGSWARDARSGVDENGRLSGGSARGVEDTVRGVEMVSLPSGKQAIVVPYKPGSASVDLNALFPNAPVYDNPSLATPSFHPNLSRPPSSPDIRSPSFSPTLQPHAKPSYRRPVTAPNTNTADSPNRGTLRVINPSPSLIESSSPSSSATLSLQRSQSIGGLAAPPAHQRSVTLPPSIEAVVERPSLENRGSSYSEPSKQYHIQLSTGSPAASAPTLLQPTQQPSSTKRSSLEGALSSSTHPYRRRDSTDTISLAAAFPSPPQHTSTYASNSPAASPEPASFIRSLPPPSIASRAARVESTLDPDFRLPVHPSPSYSAASPHIASSHPAPFSQFFSSLRLEPPISELQQAASIFPDNPNEQLHDQLLTLHQLGQKVALDEEGKPVVGRRVSCRHVAVQAVLPPPLTAVDFAPAPATPSHPPALNKKQSILSNLTGGSEETGDSSDGSEKKTTSFDPKRAPSPSSSAIDQGVDTSDQHNHPTPTLSSPSTFSSSTLTLSSSSSHTSLTTPSSSANPSPLLTINPVLPTLSSNSSSSGLTTVPPFPHPHPPPPLSPIISFPRRDPKPKSSRSLRPSTSPDVRLAEFGPSSSSLSSRTLPTSQSQPSLQFLDLQKPNRTNGSGSGGGGKEELRLKIQIMEERLERETLRRKEAELGMKRLQKAGGEQVGRWEEMAGWALSVMEASEREKTLLETDNRRLKREVKSLRMRVDAMLDSSFSAAQSPSFSLAGPKSPSFAATTLGERIREEEGRTRTESGETYTTSGGSTVELGSSDVGGGGEAAGLGIGYVVEVGEDEKRKGSWDGALP